MGTLGGRWQGSLQGWLFPRSKSESVVHELRASGHEVQDADQLGSAAHPLAMPASGSLIAGAQGLLITGDTRPVKDLLKALGGCWQGSLQGWLFPHSKREVVVGKLRT